MQGYPAGIIVTGGLAVPLQHMLNRDGQLIEVAQGIAVDVAGKLATEFGDPLLGGRIERLVGIRPCS